MTTFRLQQTFAKHCNMGGYIKPAFNSVFVGFPRSWRGFRAFARDCFELDNISYPVGFIDCTRFK